MPSEGMAALGQYWSVSLQMLLASPGVHIIYVCVYMLLVLNGVQHQFCSDC